MAVPKKYIHDHFVLLLVSITAFLFILSTTLIVVRLSGSHSASYIVQCRDCSNPTALNKFITGGVADIISFIIFSLIVLIANTVLSMKVYTIHRQLAIAVLGLGILLQVLTIAVSNALLVLR